MAASDPAGAPGSRPGGAGPDGAPEGPDEPDEPTEAERRRERRTLVLLLTPLALAVTAGIVASALTPTLLARHPLALIALDARNRNLILTASLVDPVPFYVVAVLRLVLVDPFTYLLGRRYGDAGVRWVKRRFSGMAPTVELLESVFKKAAPVAVALAPGALICVLAGATGMAVPVFLVANLLGTVVRVALLRLTGGFLEGPVDAVRGFFDRYIVWTTLASVLLVVLWLLSERRRGREPEGVASVGEMAEDLEHEIDVREGPSDPRPGGDGPRS